MGHSAEKLKALTVEKLVRKPGMYGDGKGLWLRVTKPQVASWCFRFMLDKKAHEMGLGPFPEITLKRAREKATEARRLKVEGRNPLTERKAVKASKAAATAKAMTFRQCAQAYIEAHRASWKNDKHAAQWPATLEKYAYPTLGHLVVQDIDVGLVMKVLKPIWEKKPETASRLRGRIELVLNWAKAHEYRQGENPAAWKGKLENLLPRKSKVARVVHHPALPHSEISEFISTVKESSDTAARALEFCILTATRTSETLGSTWDEINLKEKLWTIPAKRMKAGKELRVPLSDRAIEILKAQKQGNSDNFVFRGRNGGQLSNMSMLMLLRRIGRDDLTVHGFRSTFRDWAGETTAHPREVIEHALAHQLKDRAEAAYARGSLFDKRRALMDDWAAACNARPEKKGTRK